jgi:DNA helicase-2/ATP-dependent DNA helicase PcrA
MHGKQSPAPTPGAAHPLLAGLNEAQAEAVRHLRGPLLVLAGPGSGKTRVITHRIAYAIEQGVEPERLLAITFTNKAADEMRRRVEALAGIRSPWISTFHSFAARLLRRHIYRLEPFNAAFSIYDADDSLQLIKECMESLDVSTQLLTPSSLLGEISRLKNRGIDDPESVSPSMELRAQVIRQVYARYIKEMARRNALDFDDLLLLLVRLFETHADILGRYREHFRLLMIDEYQDTNRVQYRIGKLLAETHRNICVTGDPDQSIYAWRGADIANILSFENDFPEAAVLKLEENYRSTQRILAAANAAIAANLQRREKLLWTRNPIGDPVRIHAFGTGEEEATEIALLVDAFRREGTPLEHIAVFYRINSLSREIEQAFIQMGIPYSIVGGVEFFERKEVKDVLAYLRLASNPRDLEALRRAAQSPPRGIGKATLERLQGLAAARDLGPIDAVDAGDLPAAASKRQRKALRDFAAIFGDLAKLAPRPVRAIVERVIARSGYVEHLRSKDPDESRQRLANVEELVNAAAQHDERRGEEASLQGFLEEVALFAGVDRWQREPDRATLMTLHSAKGLEFPIVIVCGVEEGLLPLARRDGDDRSDDEEERRLFFVGITRAQEKLYLTHCASRRRFGQHRPSIPSPFLAEVLGGAGAPSCEADAGTRFALDRRAALSGRLGWMEDGEDAGPGWEDGDLEVEEFPVGARIRHPTYGEGTVTEARGIGRRRRLVVEFDDGSRKHLVAGYARLRRLS